MEQWGAHSSQMSDAREQDAQWARPSTSLPGKSQLRGGSSQPGASQSGAPEPDASQPELGSGPYGDFYAGQPYNESARKPPNDLALAGAILSVIPPVGLGFAIFGLLRAKSMDGAGKSVAVLGIVMSLLFIAPWIYGINRTFGSTAADPGCIAADSIGGSLKNKLVTDEQQIKKDAGTAAESGDFLTTADDVQNVANDIDGAARNAQHAVVKSALQAVGTDLAEVIDDLHQLAGGNAAGLNDLQTHLSKIQTDGSAIDKVCTNALNG